MQISSSSIPNNWLNQLDLQQVDAKLQRVSQFLESEDKKKIYPPAHFIFHSLQTTRFEDVKVVILGQDPYHHPNQAHGLSFSVPKKVIPPPSLKNIFKEINTDVGIPIPTHGNLEAWAKQGVLLLNSILTVNEKEPSSHKASGWDLFTDDLIRCIAGKKNAVVFLLWGKYATTKEELIPKNKHLILKSAHPSPLSAYRGFFGSKHFSKTNNYLVEHGKTPISWAI